jgi:hypothetical protein
MLLSLQQRRKWKQGNEKVTRSGLAGLQMHENVIGWKAFKGLQQLTWTVDC